jgi:transcription elongation factor GreA
MPTRYPLRMAEIQHLSPQAHKRLSDELHDLTTRGRIDIANQIEVARLLGDLSENGDYHAAKEEQGKMHGRILHLSSVLENCEILAETSTATVAPGTIVEVRFEGDPTTEKYLFGSIEERTEGIDIVSAGSPMGKALEGAEVGDHCSYEAGAGLLTVEIVSIEK